MPRSSRHKSSKHSSRDSRDYSDPEKQSSLIERKSKEESVATVSKESGSGDKRKLDTKEHYGSLNGEYYEERASSHKDTANDRCNGGDDERGETSKKSKTSSEKSRRREEVEGDETKKSSGKHRESSRRESKEFDKGRDIKYKEGESDKLFDGEDHHIVPGKTDLKAQDQVETPGSENYPEKQSRRKKEDHGIGRKHQGDIGDVSDRVFTSGDDCLKDGKQKEEKCRDKNWVDTEEANNQRGDKQRDDRSDGKDVCESKRKETKFQENDLGKKHDHKPENGADEYHDCTCEYERNRDYEREYDQGRVRERDRYRDRDQDLGRGDYERYRYHERDWDRGWSRDRDWDHDRARTRDREKEHSRDYCHDRKRSKIEKESDFDASYLDQTGQYKDCKERRRSPDDQDDVNDSKSRITAAHTDMDFRGSRGQPDGDKTRFQRQPSSSVAQDEIGNNLDQKAKGLSSRQAADLSGVSEGGSKNRVSENTAKMEDGSVGEFQVERSSGTKASPLPLQRRYINRTDTSQSAEVEVTGQRNISRGFLASEVDRIPVDETFQAELSFTNKANQNSTSFPPWGGISSPQVGPLEEDSGANFAGRYRRGGDANMRRKQQGNVWRASPNWPSPVIPNGFIPFQHGPPHGGFQSMMPRFPSPSLLGVRPSMETSYSGIPYHMTNAERFSCHLCPLGWQNMMDVFGSHMHGFFKDMSNGNFRDESRMYGRAEWDHNRQMQGQGWDSGADAWKTQDGHVRMDVSSMYVKDDKSAQALEGDTLAIQTSHSEIKRAKSAEAGSNLTSPAKELAVSSPKVLFQEAYVDTVAETMDTVERYCRHYLSKLDISVKLTDAELHTQGTGLLKCEEGRPTSDDGIVVFVNLKNGGKAVPKAHCSSLNSVIRTENNSVFQIAMELYREQRFEMKGLPDVKHERPQVSPPHLDNDTKIDMEVDERLLEIGDASELDIAQKVEQEAELEEEEEEEEERGSSPNPGNLTEAGEDEDKKDVVEDDVFSKVLLVPESDKSVITRIHH